MNILKAAYLSLEKKNLKIFGISKVANLTDFVTTEKDVQKGNTKMPLNLARIYEEDLVPENTVQNKMADLKVEEGDDLLANLQHK